jgi:hypothetical protein
MAWIWSVENLILAIAVFHRMSIYVGFNGMTRMRTVGLFGISAVVVGFLLVVWKIMRHRGFVWLLQRHLWTVAIAAYLFALTPVDSLVHGTTCGGSWGAIRRRPSRSASTRSARRESSSCIRWSTVTTR